MNMFFLLAEYDKDAFSLIFCSTFTKNGSCIHYRKLEGEYMIELERKYVICGTLTMTLLVNNNSKQVSLKVNRAKCF